MKDLSTALAPQDARDQLVELLLAKGRITSPAVEAVFRAVPRHVFAPAGTTVQAAYADDVVITQRGADGKATSSVSAPWLQAVMLETAGLRTGSRVLEVGSGGYNAALAAEIVGPTGSVTSIDIDSHVVAHTRTALDRAGYPQVKVLQVDAEYGYPAEGGYDAIIVTVEAADVPPAWTAQLADGGRLVVPLRIRGHTRCVTLHRDGEHLLAEASLQCGFVSMQGLGRQPTRRFRLRGEDVVLGIDDDTTDVDVDALTAALDGPRCDVWSPVTIGSEEGDGFESVQLWLASQPRPYGVLTVDRERTAGLLDPQDRFTCPTLIDRDSLAYLTMRRHGDGDGRWQFGAHGFGPTGSTLATDLAGLLAAWDRQHRHGPGPKVTVHPAGVRLPDTDLLQLLVRRRHSTIAVTWLAGDHQ